MKVYWFLIYGLIFTGNLAGQSFYFGNDLSYVNEMEDRGTYGPGKAG